jgi:uncharacterized protein
LEKLIADRLGIQQNNVTATLKLLSEGATIPFIARYRKEATGSLDEVDIERIDKEHKALQDLIKRKETIFDRLKELKISDAHLVDKIKKCYDSKELEDLYLPYKPKRTTRATKARDSGLEPLAKIIMAQRQNDIAEQARRFAIKGMTSEDALQGARDIIAEWINEHSHARNQIRKIYQRSATLQSKVVKKKKEEAGKYKDYFDFSQAVDRMPGHRVLAIFRAEKEGFIKVKILIDEEYAINNLERIFVKSKGEAADQISIAIKDSFKRLLCPSLETELRNDVKEKADKEAIDIFSNNLRQLLLAPPLGSKPIMALDPGFRTGCKLVCLDEHSNPVKHTTIYPHPPQSQTQHAEQIVLDLIHKYHIKAIAIGNGTAGRETEQFIRSILPGDSSIEVYLISESGASIYSASETGREEFPELDLTVRGSISIGRRLMDPLAELVKIDPKSIGVGQYQHDVAQDKLKESLDNTVVFAVNKVGVNLNTASRHLLQYVSGIGPKTAEHIESYRTNNGGFKSRKELLEVKGLGAKAYEQAAGFLRIKDGSNPLDASAVHPESYGIAEKIARKTNHKIEDLIGNEDIINHLKLEEFVTEKVGLPTLKDIVKELTRPGLDPRGVARPVAFDESIKTINDIHNGMVLTGKVTNLTKFGAFVDIGIKENGLIHISQITNRFIKDPAEVLRLDQEVKVKILEVDLQRKRIQLTMKI